MKNQPLTFDLVFLKIQMVGKKQILFEQIIFKKPSYLNIYMYEK